MNIDDLTVGQMKQIAAMMNATMAQPSTNVAHPFVGTYCIARCYAAGVHAGQVVSVDGQEVILADSRRLWSWSAKDGIALSGLARNGLKSGKVDSIVPQIYLSDVCELIPCSEHAKESINGA